MEKTCDGGIFYRERVKEQLWAKPLGCLCGPSLFSCFSNFTYCHLFHTYAFGVLDATEHSTCIIPSGSPHGLTWGHNSE